MAKHISLICDWTAKNMNQDNVQKLAFPAFSPALIGAWLFLLYPSSKSNRMVSFCKVPVCNFTKTERIFCWFWSTTLACRNRFVRLCRLSSLLDAYNVLTIGEYVLKANPLHYALFSAGEIFLAIYTWIQWKAFEQITSWDYFHSLENTLKNTLNIAIRIGLVLHAKHFSWLPLFAW